MFKTLVLCFILITNLAFAQPPKSFHEWISQKAEVVSGGYTDSSYPVLVIGAGPAGLAAMKELKKDGILFEGVESHIRVGGLWDQENLGSPAYDRLATNSSKASNYLDEPMPESFPDFVPHKLVCQYLTHFAERNGLLPLIQFGIRVEKVRKTEQGRWRVTFLVRSTHQVYEKEYRALIVATGRYRKENALVPQDLWNQAQQNNIKVLHSSEYRNAESFRGKKVLVLGAGTSAAEIATEVSEVAEKVYLSVRTTPWIVPLRVDGKPIDQFAREKSSELPPHELMNLFYEIQKSLVGTPESLGFQSPPHGLLDRSPILDRGISTAIKERRVQLKPSVLKVEDHQIWFNEKYNESPVEVDAMIFSTGYRTSMPFFSRSDVDLDNPSFKLPYLVFHPKEPGLLFMAEVVTPQGGWPVLVEQAKVLTAYLKEDAKHSNKIQLFNAVRATPTADYEGYSFPGAEQFNVNIRAYSSLLKEILDWFTASK